MHRLQDLVRLHRLGTRARTVARRLGMSPNTERQYRRILDAAGLLAGDPGTLPALATLRDAVLAERPLAEPPPQHVSSLTRWADAITLQVTAGATPTAIYDWLRLTHADFTGSLSAVKRLCLRVRRARGVQPDDVVIPVETAPGESAQVDFGYVGRLFDPATQQLRKAWVFVLVLGYSRHLVARIVFDQRIETWLQCHADAFANLGGVPAVVVPDNLKAAVVRAAFGVADATTLNRSYRECARHYGFQVDPTPVRSPEKKGKVEAAVKYVKRNFFAARRAELDADVLQRELDRWTREIAGQRRHGTTQRRPLEVFTAVEHAALRALPTTPYVPTVWREATVHPDTHICVGRALYSVPWQLVGQRVLVRATPTDLTIYAADERVATHTRVAAGQRSTREAHLPPERRDLRHRSRTYWEERAERLGPEVGAYVRAVFAADDVLLQLRAAQQIVRHLERFPVARARAACARAHFFASFGYPAIKAILAKALDQQPLPGAATPPAPGLVAPRFARDLRTQLTLVHTEARHASH
jgi:transposase